MKTGKFLFVLLVSLVFHLNVSAGIIKVDYVRNSGDSLVVCADSVSCAVEYSEDAEATVNIDTKVLTIKFYADFPSVCINVYREGKVIFSKARDVKPGNVYLFDLSRYGGGQYRIVVSVHVEDDLCGSFSI